MKEIEIEMIDQLNEYFAEAVVFEGYVIEVDNKFSAFDAENSKYIVELKYRHRKWGDVFIEKYKLDRLVKLADESKREVLYVNKFPDGSMYVWNISRMIKAGFDFGFKEVRMNAKTEFGGGGKVMKMVGYLPVIDEFKI